MTDVDTMPAPEPLSEDEKPGIYAQWVTQEFKFDHAEVVPIADGGGYRNVMKPYFKTHTVLWSSEITQVQIDKCWAWIAEERPDATMTIKGEIQMLETHDDDEMTGQVTEADREENEAAMDAEIARDDSNRLESLPGAAQRKEAAEIYGLVVKPNRQNAGLIRSSKVKATGFYASVYDGKLADMDTDSGRWQTVCEQHGTVVSHRTKKLALSHRTDVAGWCEQCRAEVEHWAQINQQIIDSIAAEDYDVDSDPEPVPAPDRLKLVNEVEAMIKALYHTPLNYTITPYGKPGENKALIRFKTGYIDPLAPKLNDYMFNTRRIFAERFGSEYRVTRGDARKNESDGKVYGEFLVERAKPDGDPDGDNAQGFKQLVEDVSPKLSYLADYIFLPALGGAELIVETTYASTQDAKDGVANMRENIRGWLGNKFEIYGGRISHPLNRGVAVHFLISYAKETPYPNPGIKEIVVDRLQSRGYAVVSAETPPWGGEVRVVLAMVDDRSYLDMHKRASEALAPEYVVSKAFPGKRGSVNDRADGPSLVLIVVPSGKPDGKAVHEARGLLVRFAVREYIDGPDPDNQFEVRFPFNLAMDNQAREEYLLSVSAQVRGAVAPAWRLIDDRRVYNDARGAEEISLTFRRNGAEGIALFRTITGNGRLSRPMITFVDQWREDEMLIGLFFADRGIENKVDNWLDSILHYLPDGWTAWDRGFRKHDGLAYVAIKVGTGGTIFSQYGAEVEIVGVWAELIDDETIYMARIQYKEKRPQETGFLRSVTVPLGSLKADGGIRTIMARVNQINPWLQGDSNRLES